MQRSNRAKQVSWVGQLTTPQVTFSTSAHFCGDGLPIGLCLNFAFSRGVGIFYVLQLELDVFLLSPQLWTPPNLKEFRNDENFDSIFSDFSSDTILPGGTAMIPWHWSFSVSEKWWYIVPLLWAVAVLAVVLILRHLTTGGACGTPRVQQNLSTKTVLREKILEHTTVWQIMKHTATVLQLKITKHRPTRNHKTTQVRCKSC